MKSIKSKLLIALALVLVFAMSSSALACTAIYVGSGLTEDGSTMFGDILDTPDSTTKGMTYATVIILGLVLPIAPITLGLCLPHSKKLGYKKRWYLLTALGGAWLVLGALVLIMTLIVL